jgi:hypothetical protein
VSESDAVTVKYIQDAVYQGGGLTGAPVIRRVVRGEACCAWSRVTTRPQRARSESSKTLSSTKVKRSKGSYELEPARNTLACAG